MSRRVVALMIRPSAAARAEEIARAAQEAADRAMAKAEEALVKKIVRKLTQSEWTIYGAIIILAVIFGAVLLAVAITGGL